ncbi:WD repeat-containing protein 83 [Gaertneriomyces sp. JEL0708]|nr:WD repeat-containing protein 83 [Gaertneriomyces sp. JEL0708]
MEDGELPLPKHQIQVLRAHKGPIHSASYSQDGNYCLTAGADRTVRLWNPETGLLLKTYEGHGKDVFDVAIPRAGADNSRFASCSGDRAVYIWDVGTGKPIRRFTGHDQRVNAISFNKDATVVASGSYDARVRLWDCRSNSRYPIQILEDAKDSVESVQICDSEILSGSVDGCIRIHDVRMGELITDKVGHPVSSAAFSADKNCVLVSSLDSTIRLFDKENGELLNAYTGHTHVQYRLSSCLSNTDAHVISGSEDGRICMWDLVEGTMIRSLQAHEGAVTSVIYHPLAEKMLSTGTDGTLKAWASQKA